MGARRLLGLARGFPGHPSHPPFTDATTGALTLGVVLAILGWLGVAEEAAARASVLAIAVGLVLSVPTLVTGFLDYLAIPRGTARWRTASVHWLAMVFAVSVFLVAAAALQPGYDDGEVRATGAIAAVLAEALLLVGGWLGGAVVFVHGERVLALPDEPARAAAVPQAVERAPLPPTERGGAS
jgi:uncharacterized membrane protein